MKIWDAKAMEGTSDVLPGTIANVDKEAFYVQTGNGYLKVCELQIPGKKRMDAAAFMRGYQVKAGEVLERA